MNNYAYTHRDAAIEQEIAELLISPNVLLAQRYDEVRAERLRYLQQLRDLEQRGKDLTAAGVTMADLGLPY